MSLAHARPAATAVDPDPNPRWPWAALRRAHDDRRAADRRALAAGTDGDTEARAAAEFDRAAAAEAWFGTRAEVANVVEMGLKHLLDNCPAELDALIAELPAVVTLRAEVAELRSHAAEAIGVVMSRLDAVSDELAAIKRRVRGAA